MAHLRVIITRPAPLPRRHLLSWPPLGFLWGIRIPTTRSVGLSASSFATGLVITLAGSSDAVREFILKWDSIERAARSRGDHYFVAIAVGPTSTEALATDEALRELDEVTSVETWGFFDLVKENSARATEQMT